MSPFIIETNFKMLRNTLYVSYMFRALTSTNRWRPLLDLIKNWKLHEPVIKQKYFHVRYAMITVTTIKLNAKLASIRSHFWPESSLSIFFTLGN